MKVLFMGTPDFAVGTLEALADAGHQVCLAVTQPDKPKGRGKEMQPPPVKVAAERLGIPVFQPKKVREPECVERLKECQADVCVVVAFGQILPKAILDMTPYGCINVHASLLPRYRGAAPIQWAILQGEQVTGVTTMQMDEGLDTGDMLLKTEVPVTAEETGESLHDKLALAGAGLAVQTLHELEKGTLCPQKQGESPTPYARMLDKKMGNIDWNQPVAAVERLIRGLNPWPGSYTCWNGKILKIWKASVEPGKSGAESAEPGKPGAESAKTGIPTGKPQPGTILAVGRDFFTVQAGDGVLRVEEVQLPGKKRMDVCAFLRGNAILPGTVLQPGE